MWTRDEALRLMDDLPIPWAFLRFDTRQTPPYAILRMDNSRNVYSDLKMIDPLDTFSIELYYRDPEDRFEFERWLFKTRLVWERVATDLFIESEQLYESVYDI